MKRLFKFIVVSLSLVLLSKCGLDFYNASFTKEELNEAAAKVKIGFKTGETLRTILSDIELPYKVKHNSKTFSIKWYTSDSNVIGDGGRVSKQNKDTQVTLTAEVKGGNLTTTKDFEAVVLSQYNGTNLSNSLAYLKKSSIDASSLLPNSLQQYSTLFEKVDSAECQDEGYNSACFTSEDVVGTKTEAYEDVLDTVKAFSLIKKYSELIEKSMPAATYPFAIGYSYNVPNMGRFKVVSSKNGNRYWYTYVGSYDFTSNGAKLKLTMQTDVKYDETSESFEISYKFDIKSGFAFFGVSVYELTAVAHANNMYQIKDLTVASKMKGFETKLSRLVVSYDRTAIELFSYRNSTLTSDYKSYIYANNKEGYSYFWTSGSPLNPFSGEKSSFEIFNRESKLYELNLKGSNEEQSGAAKFYFSGISGYDSVGVNKPFMARWSFNINFTNGTSLKHSNYENQDSKSFRIEREDAYSYSEKYNSDESFAGFERKKTGQDVYYIMVNPSKYSEHGSLYELPNEFLENGARFEIANIERNLNVFRSRIQNLTILSERIFEDSLGKETGRKIVIVIPTITFAFL